MNIKNIVFLSLLLMLVTPAYFSLSAQTLPDLQKPEKPITFTDRGFYISGEKIRFSVFNISTKKYKAISNVAYLELVSPNGTIIAKGKFQIDKQKANGCLTIPSNLPTGNYYLKTYTRYLQNFGTNYYFFVPVTIINPYLSAIASGTDSLIFRKSINAKKNISQFLSIKTNKQKFNPGDIISISIAKNTDDANAIQQISVSVIPQFTTPNLGNVLSSGITKKLKKLSFIPETRGITITGILRDSITKKHLPETRINLSIVGPDNDYIPAKTKKNGEFNISLPDNYGYHDIFVSTENINHQHPQILIENDFSHLLVHLPNPTLHLSGNQKETGLKMAKNYQIRKAYYKNLLCTNSNVQNDSIPFYGKPSFVLALDQYVELPSLEEYFNELPSIVKIRVKNNKKYFKIIGPQPGMANFKPLVMVDNVAIDNPDKILAASPSEIARIEVVNRLYVKGNYSFGGVINIISKHHDFAAIDLPKSGIFMNYLFFSDTCNCRPEMHFKNNIPDAKNTLYWNPSLNIKNNTPVTINVIAPETPDNYIIVLQGVNSRGKPFLIKKTIEVTKN